MRMNPYFLNFLARDFLINGPWQNQNQDFLDWVVESEGVTLKWFPDSCTGHQWSYSIQHGPVPHPPPLPPFPRCWQHFVSGLYISNAHRNIRLNFKSHVTICNLCCLKKRTLHCSFILLPVSPISNSCTWISYELDSAWLECAGPPLYEDHKLLAFVVVNLCS